jgi:Na+/melibiose symporter-like transporter
VIPPLGSIGLAICLALIIISVDTAFTLIHVGFNALTPVMTSDYDDRFSLHG